jgi:hypothetical protein
MVFRQLAKPWYVWRPWQLVRRASVALKAPRSGYVPLPVAWGISVIADPANMITLSNAFSTRRVEEPIRASA